MKKQLFLLVFMLLPLVASAEKVEIDGIFYNLNSEAQTAEVTSNSTYGGYSGDIVIPASVSYDEVNYNVTSIAEGAFESCKSLTSINIPNSITTIAKKTFSGCHKLISIDIPNSVTTIREKAFQDCFLLTSVNLPNSVTSIEDEAFTNCGLTSFSFGNSVTSIGRGVFDGCYYLTTIEIPDNWTTIGNGVFRNCGLISVNIPNNITEIGDNAFRTCTSLISINITNSVTKIGNEAFGNCRSLASIVIPKSTKKLGMYAFNCCFSLTNVYCYAEEVPVTDSHVFNDVNFENATLHVPAASIDTYSNAKQWKNFGTIVALTDEDPKPTTEITATIATQQPTIVERYTIDGKRVNQPQRGLNIIKMSDGTTKKVVVK